MSTEHLHVFMVTSEWPTPEHPHWAPFVVRQVQFLQKAGVDVTVMPFRGNRQPGNYLRAWRQARQALHGGDYDLIHAQWGQSALAVLPRRLPLVITYRGDDLGGMIGAGGRRTLTGHALRSFSRLVSLAADEVIVVSERMGRMLPRRSYHVIPSGIDLDLFRPIPKAEARAFLGLPAEQPLVLFAGSTGNPTKRFWLARAALAEVQKQMNAELIVANKAPHEQIPYYMSACDVLLLTSVQEGSPNVVKEALACNLRVVSTDVGDVRERIAGLPGCTVCPSEQPEALAQAIAQALCMPGRLDSRGTVLNLSEERIAQQVIAVYRQAIARFKQKQNRSQGR